MEGYLNTRARTHARSHARSHSCTPHEANHPRPTSALTSATETHPRERRRNPEAMSRRRAPNGRRPQATAGAANRNTARKRPSTKTTHARRAEDEGPTANTPPRSNHLATHPPGDPQESARDARSLQRDAVHATPVLRRAPQRCRAATTVSRSTPPGRTRFERFEPILNVFDNIRNRSFPTTSRPS